MGRQCLHQQKQKTGSPLSWNLFWCNRPRSAQSPLEHQTKENQQKKSAVRSVVEHAFACIKTKQRLLKATAKNLERNALRFSMNCINYNLLRADY